MRGAHKLQITLLLFSFQCALFADEDQQARSLHFQNEIRIEGIARFSDLPYRMDLEPQIEALERQVILTDDMVPFFQNLVEGGPDNEIRIQAVNSLSRIHRENLAELSGTASTVAACLSSTDNDDLKTACAMFLGQIQSSAHVEAVVSLCDSDHVPLCRLAEPQFISWGKNALQEEWISRVKHPRQSAAELVAMACEGLAKLDAADAEEPLFRLLGLPAIDFSIRDAAARTAGRLQPDRAALLADKLCRGDLRQRLLACSLLSTTTSDDGFEQLIQLCKDDSGAVASRAWATVLTLNADKLVPLLTAGTTHGESNVRLSAIEVLRKFATAEHCGTLYDMCNDPHIAVRNAARRAIRDVASDKSLHAVILDLVGNVLTDASSGWERLEQSLVLLAELKEPRWHAASVPLLKHPRAEVFISAAWLLHLMPTEAIAAEVGNILQQRFELLQTSTLSSEEAYALSQQLTFLFQFAGTVQLEAATAVLETQFNKNAGMPGQRGAAMWALGQLNRGTPNNALIQKQLERIFDDDPFGPENMYVRQKCVLALAAMKARENVADLEKAYHAYGEHTLLGQTAFHVLSQLGAPQPEFTLPPLQFRDFPVLPITKE